MSASKIIVGIACFLAAVWFGLAAKVCLTWGGYFVAFFPAVYAVYLVIIGSCLILKRHSTISKNAKMIIVGVLLVVFGSTAMLDIHIRHERKMLQVRANEFLSRPIPKMLIPDSEGYVGEDYVGADAKPPNVPLGYSRPLIERYANNGRIRWSAVIQGEFASTSDQLSLGSGPKSDAVLTNQEVIRYIDERNAILSKEWKMGFWQWVEDLIEFKMTIPEFEEEDVHINKDQPMVLTNTSSVLK